MAETPDLEILLKTAADTAGVDKVRSALEKLASDAKAGSVESLRGLDQLSEEGRRALGVLGEEGSRHMEQLSFHGREFHRVLHEVTRASPELGVALRAVLNPLTAGFAIAVIAIERMHEAWKKFQESMALGGKWEDQTKVIEAQRLALDEASHSAEAFRRKLDEVATVEDKLKAATELSIALLQERAREQDAERSSELALKKAEIDAKSRAGLVSELDALKQKNDLENQFAREKIERENRIAQAVIAAKQKEREEVRQLIPGAEAEQARAEAALAAAEKPETRKAVVERLRSHAEAAKEEFQKATDAASSAWLDVLPAGARKDLQEQLNLRLENARAASEATEAALAAAVAGEYDVQEGINKLKEATQSTEKRLLELKNLNDKLGEEIERSLYIESGAARSRLRVAGTEERTRGIVSAQATSAEMEKLTPQIAAAEQAVMEAGRYGSAVDKTVEVLSKLPESLARTSEIQSKVFEHLETVLGIVDRSNIEHEAALRDIRNRIETVGNWVNTNRQ